MPPTRTRFQIKSNRAAWAGRCFLFPWFLATPFQAVDQKDGPRALTLCYPRPAAQWTRLLRLRFLRIPERLSFMFTTRVVLALVITSPSAMAIEPTDPNAIPQARKLLHYLDGLKAKTVDRVLSGQSVDNSVRSYYSQFQKTYDTYKYWPVIFQSQMYYYWTERAGLKGHDSAS